MPISELVFGTLTQNRSSLEPSLGFSAIARHTPLCMHDTHKPPKSRAPGIGRAPGSGERPVTRRRIFGSEKSLMTSRCWR